MGRARLGPNLLVIVGLPTIAVLSLALSPPRAVPEEDFVAWVSVAPLFDRGWAPFRDIPQGKGPVLFMYARLLDKLPRRPYMGRFAEEIGYITAEVIVFLTVAAAAGSVAPGLLAALFMATAKSFWFWGARTMMPQLILMPLAALASVGVYRSRRPTLACAACGFFVGLAALARQTGAIEGAALAAALVLWPGGIRKRWLAAVYFLIGALAAAVVASAWLASYGTHPLDVYRRLFVHVGPSYAAKGTPRALERLKTSVEALSGFLPFAALALAALIWGLCVAPSPARAVARFTAAWLVGALAGAVAPVHFFPHYFLALLPPLSIAAGLFVPVALSLPSSQARTVAWGTVAAAAAVCLVALLPRASVGKGVWASILADPCPPVPAYMAGRYIAANSRPDDWLMCWESAPTESYFARVPPLGGWPWLANRLAAPAWSHVPAHERRRRWAEWKQQMRKYRPSFVVVDVGGGFPPPQQFRPIADELRRNYVRDARFGNVQLYRRRSTR